MDDAETLFAGGGQVGELMATFDWSATPLGPPRDWPAPLRQIVRVMLTSRFAMWLAWGPELTVLYNDAYVRDTLRTKHPWALGRPTREVWGEIWDDIGPRIGSVLQTGMATWDESLLLFLERAGYAEETYHTFSYSPLHDEDGVVTGMLCVVSEDTDRVLGERRLRILSELGDVTAVTAPTTSDACAAAMRVIERDRRDIPFAVIYLFEDDGLRARRAEHVGLAADPKAVPLVLGGNDPSWRLLDTSEPQLLRDWVPALGTSFVPLGAPMPDHDPQHVIVAPLTAGGNRPMGALILGLSPFRAFDGEYERFVDLLAGGVSTAIADARGLQAQLRRAAELAELDRAKTEFFTSVSHELRTPLTLISGPAADGLDDTEDPMPPAQRERMQVILRNARRLRRLISTMLEFGQMEAGRLVPAPTVVDLAALTRGIVESFAPAIRRAGLELHVECRSLPSAAAVDVDMWEKIVLNLLSNAVKYTHTGRIELRLRALSSGVELAVSDTGIGIAASEVPKLFDRFHRVRGASGRTIEGSGVGLALVAELSRLIGGTVSVSSTVGAGSTFTVTLPTSVLTDAVPVRVPTSATAELFLEEALQWSDPDSHSTPPVELGSTAGATVLVVEDNRDLRAFLVGLLAVHYRVLEAADGRSGLQRALAERPDIVLTDVMMPGWDGFELLARLRADPSTATIPVVMLSARAGEESAIEGLTAGADDYLAKPFSSSDLLARVRSNLELARMRSREGAWRTALVNALQDALVVVDPAGRVVEINDAFADVLGYGAEGLPYSPPFPWWPDPVAEPDEFAHVAQSMIEAQAGGGRFEVPQRHRYGRMVWLDVSTSTIAGSDGGKPVVVGLLRDVTADRKAASRTRLLAQSGMVLSSSDPLFDRLSELITLAAPIVADAAAVALMGPDGRLRTTAAAHATDSGFAGELLRAAPRAVVGSDLPRYRAGRAFVTDPPAGSSLPREPQECARLEVPLVVDGRLLGALTFYSMSGSRDVFEDADAALAEELGRRAALMLEADRIANREQHLHLITSALGAAASAQEVARILASSMNDITGSDGAAVYVVRPDDGERLHLQHRTGRIGPVIEPSAARPAAVRLHEDLPQAEAARTGTPLWVGTSQKRRERFPLLGPFPGEALAALPLVAGTEIVGVTMLSFPTERLFDAEERAFVTMLLAPAAQALARAITTDAHRRIADTLQHSLLPATIPAVPRLAVATRYLPAGVHNAAGGDWYDVVVLDDDHIGISVGDVVGHGARAAAVMGQLRSATRAYLLETRDPGHAIAWLSRFANGTDEASFGTATCLVIDVAAGAMRWASAGHPPPLLVEATGRSRFLDDAQGTILGLLDDPFVVEGHVRVAPGDTVVLYTDGLVERRGEVIDDGLARLAAAARSNLAPAQLVPLLLEKALGTVAPTDDVAIVAARLLPPPLHQRLPAQPEQLAFLRRKVASWAGVAGLPEEQRDDLQLALGEAATNAIEHAYRDATPGWFEYQVDNVGSGAIDVRVSDSGRWQPPAETPYRGRGLPIIKKLASRMHLDRGENTPGTTVRFTLPAAGVD